MKFFNENYSMKKFTFFLIFLGNFFATLHSVHLLVKSNNATWVVPIIIWGIASYLWYKNYSNA